MATFLQAHLGAGLILLFCLSQALRDVYFGHVFQGVDFFAIILLAFLLSTAIFGALAWWRSPGDFRKLRGHAGTVIAINLATALAWSCYFFALTHLEPSVVNTLHSGMAPLTVVALAAFGVPMARTGTVGWPEYFGYAGIALSLAALAWVVLSGSSGLAGTGPEVPLALLLVMVSGASITVSLLCCKRLHDHDISAEVVTTVRYVALIAVAGGVLFARGQPSGIETAGQFATLALFATALIVVPLHALQVSIARTATLTAHVLRALGPVFVFAAQQFDGRLSYSAATLICILAYSAAAIVSNLAHAGRSGHAGAHRGRALMPGVPHPARPC